MSAHDTLTDEHIRVLTEGAVDIALARSLGVYSVREPAHLPEGLKRLGRFAVPSLAFPWRGGDGSDITWWQLRFDDPPDPDHRYTRPSGLPNILGLMKKGEDGGDLWIVEGTKQALAVASHAPADVEVRALAGCWGWRSRETFTVEDLWIADGRTVVALLDADLKTNLAVWSAADELVRALKLEGAEDVKIALTPGGGKLGIDDVLGKRATARRADFLQRLMGGATSRMPAKPKPSKNVEEPDAIPSAAGRDRPTVVVNGDRYDVIKQISEVLVTRWDRWRLFNYGGVLTQLEGVRTEPLTKDAFAHVVAETVSTVAVNPKGESSYQWPDSPTMGAMLSQAGQFAPLEQVSRIPFVRPDGSICLESGYDAPTKTFVVLDEALSGIDVPEEPSPAQVSAAITLLAEDWLGDFAMSMTPADHANLLGLALTPLVRGLVPLVPLAVVDGLQMGVGKNILADIIAILMSGKPAAPLPYTRDDSETRKVITSAFRSGADLFVFDEAHVLEGASFARAITSITYQDRVLGASNMAEFPNKVTWMSLGNQVQVNGDMSRRVYRIAIRPEGANPQDRPTSIFRNQKPREWALEHRAELLAAGLTLVRAWFAAGRPAPAKGVSFGSFEAWEKTVGGILALAGVHDFLGNLAAWRSESDLENQYWFSHLAWLHEKFGDVPFTSADVVSAAIRDPREFEAPPGLDDPSVKGYSKAIGSEYARRRDRNFNGYRLIKVGEGHRGVAKWSIKSDLPGSEGGSGGTGGTPSSLRVGKNIVTKDDHPRVYARTRGEGIRGPSGPSGPSAPFGTAIFDLETAGAETLFSYGPGFVRLAGYSLGNGAHLTTDPGELVTRLQGAAVVTGHNILGFDLLALAHHHGLDIHELVARGAVFDTLLAARHIDPPPAREHRKYDLDTLGQRLQLGGKNGDLKKLAREFGGYDQIPLDEPRYRTYLEQDVALSAALYEHLKSDDTYLAREHRVAAIAAQITLNGFRVDEDLLATRIAEGEQRKAEALQTIADRHGVPLTDAKGKRCASPLATKAGKQALIDAFTRLGATYYPKTATGELMTSGDGMREMAAEFPNLPEVAALCELVAQVTSERTIYSTVAKHVTGGRVHPGVSMEQSTGRWSITKPGLTVIGKRGGRWRERQVFLPEDGHVIISADLSQVDARAVAALSGDTGYMSLFAPGIDAHAEVARMVWNDPSRRDDAKPLGHGWNYGMGTRRMSETAGVPLEVAEQFDATMREQFPRLVAWREEVRQIAKSGELLDNGFGRRMRPDPQRAHTQGPAFMGQGCARDLMMEGLLRLPQETYPYLRAVVHDEVVLSAPVDIAADVERAVVDALSFEWRGMPIVAEVSGRGRNWGEVYEK
jgi:DNA polymerase-1